MDLSDYIGSVSIRLPDEEFDSEPFVDTPTEPTPEVEPPVPLISLAEQLLEELDQLQELIELIEDTAEDFSVELSPELSFLGTSIDTAQYVDIKRSRTNKSKALTDQFDRSVVSGCGLPNVWPVLSLDSLRFFQDSLSQTLQVVQGQLYKPTLDRSTYRNSASGSTLNPAQAVPADWEVSATRYLNQLASTQIAASSRYRSRFSVAVASMGSSLSNGLLTYFFQPALDAELQEIAAAVTKVKSILVKVRQMLCLGMALQALKILAVRDAVQRIFRAIIQQAIITQLAALFNKALDTVVTSLLTTFESHSDDKRDIGDLVEDVVAEQLSAFLQEGVSTVVGYANRLVASLIRQSHEQSTKALSEISLLEQRTRITRWLQHIDQGIILCDTINSGLTSKNLVRGLLNNFISSSLIEPTNKLYQRMKAHPQYENVFKGDINTSPYISRIA